MHKYFHVAEKCSYNIQGTWGILAEDAAAQAFKKLSDLLWVW